MSNLQKALDAYKNGELIIVTDDADRENEGDLMLLAEKATPEKVAFMVRHTTGILCVAMTAERARELRLPLMVEENQDSKKTAFTVSVDYKIGITTGVSATERANTVRALADNSVVHSDFIRPGHIFPLIADNGGLEARGGHTEAGVALSHLVGAQPLCLLSEIVNDDGSMARGASLEAFAAKHAIPMISVEELKAVAPVVPTAAPAFEFAWAQLPLRTGVWSIATYPGLRQREHAVIAFGDAGVVPMIRIHSECFTGDVVHSQRCDCGEQLEQSIEMIQKHGHGYIVYLRDHEGRGIGLTEKIKAYQLQDQGMDTIDANLHLGHEVDARDWSDAIAIVRALGLKGLTLLTNNPNKVQALQDAGVEVTQANLSIQPNKFNEKYLATKEEKLGHSRGGM
ncbi:MAG: 3,4-dihydroxy-2-butanone-4-phosphate synthase [Candidatus Planktophila sp.]|nr:3,4-dihydroxy-2-butanone-4-phosphate synthase [Candidatus Planktophila sp.]